jgi:hypothetical protein
MNKALTNTTTKKIFTSLLVLWLISCIVGVVEFVYKYVVHTQTPFSPELEPFYMWFTILIFNIMSASTSAFIFSRIWNFSFKSYKDLWLFSTFSFLVFCYTFFRTARVELALTEQYIHYCCREYAPKLSETLNHVLNPLSLF